MAYREWAVYFVYAKSGGVISQTVCANGALQAGQMVEAQYGDLPGFQLMGAPKYVETVYDGVYQSEGGQSVGRSTFNPLKWNLKELAILFGSMFILYYWSK